MKAEKARLTSGLDISFERTTGVKDAFRMLESLQTGGTEMLIIRKRLGLRAALSAPNIFDAISRVLHGLTRSALATVP